MFGWSVLKTVISNHTLPSMGSRSAPRDVYGKVEVVPSQDEHWVQADELLRERGIDPTDHALMQENLATYLAHGRGGIPSARWQNKIERELADPYTDQAVLEHLEDLEDSLQDNLRRLPKMPSRLYLSGSFAKGRLGGNSDLDGYAVVDPDQLEAGFDLFVAREQQGDGANLVPLSSDSPGYNRAHRMLAGQTVEITPQQALTEGFLLNLYERVRSEREQRIETHQVFEWITDRAWSEELSAEEKREALSGRTLGARIQNMSLSLGGTLSTVPLLGGVVNGVADLFVTQKHRDYRSLPAVPEQADLCDT